MEKFRQSVQFQITLLILIRCDCTHKKHNCFQRDFSPLDATEFYTLTFQGEIPSFFQYLTGAYQGWRLQRVDVLSLHVVELHQGIPANGGTGSLGVKPQSLHAGHSQQVSLGAPLGLNICGEGGEIELCDEMGSLSPFIYKQLVLYLLAPSESQQARGRHSCSSS